jgi:hypothetical protein
MVNRSIAAITLVLAYASSANAGVIYHFSFSNVIGNTAGTIEGLITLDFLASTSDSGVGAASDLRITSAPVGIPASVEGADLTEWLTQAQNRFEVVNGVIADYEFGASEGSPSTLSDNILCLNNGLGFTFPPGSAYNCGINENWFGNNSAQVYNTNGIGGVTFQQQAVTVPTPGVLPLFLLGATASSYVIATCRRNKNRRNG